MRSVAKARKAKELKKYGQRWGIKRVVGREYKEELNAVIKERWNAEPGSKTYLQRYHEGLNIVMDRRTKEELEEADAIAQEMNTTLLPDDIRAR